MTSPSPFAAPHVPPAAGVLPPPTPTHRGRALGIVALTVAAVAVPLAAAVAAIVGFQIGLGAGKEIASRPLDADLDWSVLTPVRAQVLAGEIAFWAATALGLWALVQGAVAIASARGRAQGIAAVAVAAVGPVLFFCAVALSLQAGLDAGTGIGG